MSRKLRTLVLTVALVSILVVGLVSTAVAAPPTFTCTYGWGDPVLNVAPRYVHEYEQIDYVCTKN